MSVSPVLVAAREYQAQLDALNASLSNDLIESYNRSWERIEAMLNALLLEIGDSKPTKAQIKKLREYQALIDRVTAELSVLQTMTENTISDIGKNVIPIGERNMRNLLAIILLGTLASGINLDRAAGSFNTVTPDVIEVLTGWLNPGSPLFERLRQLTGVNALYVANAMIEGITLGFNPRKIARLVQSAFGRGLTDALRFVRTANLWAYREANRASMVANQDILEGWVWSAHFDDRVCMSCVAMHGTIHPVDEPLNDHHNGRCAPIPLVRGFPNPVDQTGIEWFAKQSEATQRKLMGREFYDAWKGGAFDLSEMSTTRRDEVYGDMRVETPLWQLLGAEPPVTVTRQGVVVQ